MMPRLMNVSYEERVFKLNLPSLYCRHERGDVVKCYKTTHWYYDMLMVLNLDKRSGLCGHRLKLAKEFTRKSVRKHFWL